MGKNVKTDVHLDSTGLAVNVVLLDLSKRTINARYVRSTHPNDE